MLKRRTSAAPILGLALACGIVSCTPQMQSGTLPNLDSLVASRAATADLLDPSGTVTGTATFDAVGGGAQIKIQVSGLKPGKHGLHIHVNPNCTDTKDSSGKTVVFGGAGGHYDPDKSNTHAMPTTPNKEGHGGDLPNLVVGQDGVGKADFYTEKVSLSGDNSVMGRSIVIHTAEDDYTTQPSGNSGARERCGIIKAPQ